MTPYSREILKAASGLAIAHKAQVGDMGIDGHLFRVGSKPSGRDSMFPGDWFPIQVKPVDKVGRPDIESFKAGTTGQKREPGVFFNLGSSADAQRMRVGVGKPTRIGIVEPRDATRRTRPLRRCCLTLSAPMSGCADTSLE